MLDLKLNDPSRNLEQSRGPSASLLDYTARPEHLMRVEQLDEAEQAILRAAAILTDVRGQERALLIDVLPRAASLYYRKEDVERPKSVMATFEHYAEQSGRTLPVLEPLTNQIYSYQSSLRGDLLHAADFLAAAADRFMNLVYRWRAAMAHHDAADASRDAGLVEEAKLHFEAAFQLFSDMGAVEKLAHVRAEMLSLGVRAHRRLTRRRATLTARQWQIAELAARGMSDPKIADALWISRRTASTHMHHILNAIGLRSRVQLDAWTAAHQQDRAEALRDMM